jgi:hypothetical protein
MPTQTRNEKTAQSIDDLRKRIDNLDKATANTMIKLADRLEGTVTQLGRITNKVHELERDLHQMPVAPTSNMNIVRANVLTTRVTPERIRSRARKARKTRKTKKMKQSKRKGSRKRRH